MLDARLDDVVSLLHTNLLPTFLFSKAVAPAMREGGSIDRPPGEIGAAVTYLRGRQAGWITGQALVLDGGLTISTTQSTATWAPRHDGAIVNK